MTDPVDRAVRAIARRNSYVLVTDANHELAGDELLVFEPRASVTLKGKREPVGLRAPRPATQTWPVPD